LSLAIALATVQVHAETTVNLSLPQARAAAAQALQEGKLADAARLATALLQVNPRDAEAALILALVHDRSGNAAGALRAARQAWSATRHPALRFRAADIAARSAFRLERLSLAQFWLRRADTVAPDDTARAALARDFAIVRRTNPLRVTLNFGAAPSSNVNNGSETTVNVVEGLPIVGQLSGDAQALSGVEAWGHVALRYRLNESASSRTSVGADIYARRVWLSDEARALAPTLSNDELSFDFREVSLEHLFTTGQGQPVWSFGLAAGKTLYGGADYRAHSRAELGLSLPLGPADRLTMGLKGERHRAIAAGARDAEARTLSLGFSHGFASGARLGLSLELRDTAAEGTQFDNSSQTLRLTYAPARSLGPVRVTGALALGRVHYPDYAVLFFTVPGGREDRILSGDLTLHFERLDYAGFIPTLTLRAARTESNVSRFDTRALSVVLGIRSSF
jgi:hypothetical protein